MHNVLPSPKPVPGSEANPHCLCQQKSRSLICAHLWSDVPPLRGPRLTQASLPALRLHLQQTTGKPTAPKLEKNKSNLTQAEPRRIGDKQGKRAARLSQVSYRVDTRWLLVTKLESVPKKLCSSLAQAVKPASLQLPEQPSSYAAKGTGATRA